MSKLFAQPLLQIKQEIRNRYSAGEVVHSIAKSYHCSDRNIYFHLGELTAEEKGLHAQNYSLKMTLKKKNKRKEEVSNGIKDKKVHTGSIHQGAGSTKSEGTASESSLDDFK